MTSNYPLVSVAIITYNQKQYLRECLDSVIAQDYPNIEIVVADDGSIDGSQQMLLEYQTRNDRHIVLRLSEKNQGITKNSNFAHFACSGKYIAWLGGDDLMLPNKISTQVRFMEKNLSCTICYHNLEVFESPSEKILGLYNNRKNSYEGDVRVVIKHGTFNGGSSNMVRASKIPKNGFNELIPVASDWLYWIECMRNGGSINYINMVLGKYRRHSLNITRETVQISQGQIDHLNSCNILLGLEPQYVKYIMYRYGKILGGLRKKLPYLDGLSIAFRVTFDYKLIVAYLVFIITFGFFKL